MKKDWERGSRGFDRFVGWRSRAWNVVAFLSMMMFDALRLCGMSLKVSDGKSLDTRDIANLDVESFIDLLGAPLAIIIQSVRDGLPTRPSPRLSPSTDTC